MSYTVLVEERNILHDTTINVAKSTNFAKVNCRGENEVKIGRKSSCVDKQAHTKMVGIFVAA